MNPRSFLLSTIGIVIILSLVGTIFSFKFVKPVKGAIYKVGSEKIDRHSVCRNVVNSGTREVMVPTGSKGEWCSFIGASVPNVSVTICQECSRPACSNGETCYDYNVGTCP